MSLEQLIDNEAELNFVRGVQDGLTFGDASAHRAICEVPVAAITDRMTANYYQAIRKIYKRGELPEMDLVKLELQAMGIITEPNDWIPYLVKFSEASPSASPDGLGRKILELSQRRRAWRVFGKASEDVIDPMQDQGEVIQQAAQDVLQIMTGGGDDPTPAGEDIWAMMDRGERFTDDQHSSKLAWFGIPELDADIRGGSGELVIIAARPGKGKTALLVQTLSQTVMDRTVQDPDTGYREELEGHNCLFVSLELPKKEVHARIASWFTKHRSGKFWAGRYGEAEKSVITQNKVAMNRLWVWAAPSRTPWSRIEAKIRGAVIRRGVRIVAIDYFGLIGRPEPQKGSNPYYQAGELSGQIRSLAQQLGVCIVLLCQLNREGAEGEPGMEDLRETGSLEQDAQGILALYTEVGATVPKWKGNGADPTHKTLLKVLKNRNGRCGAKLELEFDGSINHFDVTRA